MRYKRLPHRREEFIELIKKCNNRLAPSFISSSSQLLVSIKIQNIVKSLPGDWRKSDNSYAKVRPCCKGRRLPCRCQVSKKFRVVVFPSFMSQSQIGKKNRQCRCLAFVGFYFFSPCLMRCLLETIKTLQPFPKKGIGCEKKT